MQKRKDDRVTLQSRIKFVRVLSTNSINDKDDLAGRRATKLVESVEKSRGRTFAEVVGEGRKMDLNGILSRGRLLTRT